MIVLGLDSSTVATAVGLLTPGGPGAERFEGPDERGRPRHTTHLLSLAGELLSEAGLGFADVQRIAVGVGPGSFTGLRVGVATARALAQATGASIVGISSLRVLAAGAACAGGDGDRGILAALDARRGEAFAALYVDGCLGDGPAALAPAALAELAQTPAPDPGRPWLAVGDGAIRFREQLQAGQVRIPPDDSPLHRVSARVLCELAAAEPDAQPDAVLPDYVRRPDAELASGE